MTGPSEAMVEADESALAAARDLKHALAANAYPAADGTADIDNDAIPLIAITLRHFANQAVTAALAAEPGGWRQGSTEPRDKTVRFIRWSPSTGYMIVNGLPENYRMPGSDEHSLWLPLDALPPLPPPAEGEPA